MKPTHPLRGLVAATHTPFSRDGSLNLATVEMQAAHLLNNGVAAAFVGGTTGESHSLTLAERMALAERWSDATRGSALKLVIHVGANCLADSRQLAAQAQQLGAIAISALAPSYFKPRSVEILIACCSEIASATPEIPFYYYDIPVLTGVSLPMTDFISRAPEQIPSFAGLKFTNPDLMAYLQCLQSPVPLDIPWGIDEWMLGALATGAQGFVGSTYNFAAPIYHELNAAFGRGDLSGARAAQLRSAQVISILARYGYMGAAKATMQMLGVDVGPARLPNTTLTTDQVNSLRGELDALGFFQWIKK